MFLVAGIASVLLQSGCLTAAESLRERTSINENWRFYKYDTKEKADSLIYDVRPGLRDNDTVVIADEMPTEAVKVKAKQAVLKPWILPTGNDFIKDPAKHHVRPEGNPGGDFPFVQGDFDDSSWQSVSLPHDWAIAGPFFEGRNPEVGGSMGRLPSPGVAWYRRKLNIPASDEGKSIFLNVDGAMSYAMVWLNGNLVGGWPFGYASWRVNLTPYIVPGGENQLAIRLDNPPISSRWYPGGGIYRNVWLTKTNPVHVGQWGTFITTQDVSEASATINIEVTIDNNSKNDAAVKVVTQIFVLNADGKKIDNAVATFAPLKTTVATGKKTKFKGSVILKNPRLWGPPPTQTPNRYAAVTTLLQNDKPIDQYETRFGIRSLRFDPDAGVYVNAELIKLKGVNQHHGLGALGAAFNFRAAERQLEILREMGCNAIRTAHNPPAPELLELTDRMGFLVMDEAFDVWERRKTPLDFHLIFPDWHEQDLRALVRRDRNHPSVIIWSFGNEVGEQYTDEQGAAMAKRLHDTVKQEDPTRPTTSAMNWAKPNMPFPASMDVISLNYQGEGIRQSPEFEGTNRIRTSPQYPAFHAQFPDKVILSSETASAFSSRGIYLFPVVQKISDIVRDGRGGDSKIHHVTSYELHAVDFGSSADKVFGSVARHPFVAGEFVWTGWDYLGEPTPYYSSRSSYCGIVDLAGLKKDRFHLYQAHWRPDFPMAHILPHWTWPERVGQITPVHVFTSGDEAELFLNGKSLGRKTKGRYEYRLRWDDVTYEPGALKVVAYKDGREWATDVMRTAGKACRMDLKPDRAIISNDGRDLSFVTLTVRDNNGIMVPRANNLIRFSVSGPGEIVATDNGDPTDFNIFSSHDRKAFSGLAMVIVRGKPGQPGTIKLKAESDSLESATITLRSIAEKANTGAVRYADSEERPKAKSAENPIIWADVPDVAVIRVGDTYYMSSTTMHMSPGLPIMKSKDLVNWELIGYAYDRLVENDAMNLENGRSCYGRGTWASSLRYHNSTYYVSTFSSTSGRTHVYTTRDIEKGDWKETSFAPSLHDHSLFFDDDGRVYMLYGVGNLRLTELKPDLTGIMPGGFNEVVIRNASAVAGDNIMLPAEGSQMRKINGKYYLMNITWPRGGMRTQIVHRADKITGPYEGKVVLQDQGVAQGCLIDTPDGKWYAVLFQDNGSVGRSPWLVPVRWEDDWPVLGVDGKVPMTLDIDDKEEGLANIVTSDEFNRKPGDALPLAWQWNHNPDNRFWSIGERSGYLRLTTGRVDSGVLQARNILTQRTFGPVSSATTKIEIAQMKDGDYAGLIALQRRYGFVGVRMKGDSKSVVMVSAQSNRPKEVESVPLTQPIVYLRIDCDFRNRTDKAYFYYSLDGATWTKIGSVLQMAYTLPHFMGYRFGLFNYATKSASGFVDFDFFRIDNKLTGTSSADIANIVCNSDGSVTF
jgi:beta-galactosidase